MSTSNEEPYPIENYAKSCSAKFNTLHENLFYGFQVIYLVPTLALLIWILVTIRIRYWDNYRKLLWFWIFSMDCIASIVLILLDLFITRLFLYFPQLCPFFSQIFKDYPLINHIYFPLYNYVRAIKPVIQCALAFVRLLSVSSLGTLKSMEHLSKIYKYITIICLVPFLVIWNTIISEKEVVFWRGGFFIIYHRYISWASLSILHLSFLTTALIFILIICLCAHFQKSLTGDCDGYKRVMVVTTAFVVLGFLLQAGFQCYYALFRHAKWFPSQLVDYQFLIYDFLTVGTPLVVICTASRFREHLIPKTKKQRQTIEFHELRERKKSSDSKQSEECSDEENGKV